MLKPILNYWQNNALLLALLPTVFVAVGSLINPTHITKIGITVSDKILHFSAYFVLMCVWLMYTHKFPKSKKGVWVFVVLCSFGIILELFQGYLTQYRTADYLDVLSNTLGLIVGYFVFYFVVKRKLS